MNSTTSTEPAPQKDSFKKRHLVAWLALAALLFLTWFLWQLFGPSPPIIISKETTYITAPVRPDGLPDYRQYLDSQLQKGVTHENNAAVIMWQTFGPGDKDDAIDAAAWQRIVSELQLSLPASNKYLVDPFAVANATLVGDWLVKHNPEWKRAASAQTNHDDDGLLDAEALGSEAISQAMAAPWRSSDLPPLADWIQKNNSLLDTLVEGSQRPRLYTPLPMAKRDNEAPLADIPLHNIQQLRAIARVLVLRAMFHLGEGRHPEAWRDLHAIHRWARLTAQGPYLVDQLVAIAIDGIASSGDAALLSSNDLPSSVAQQMQRDLQSLPPAANLAQCFDQGERLFFLDAIVSYRDKGIGALHADTLFLDLLEDEKAGPTTFDQLLDLVRADWNVGLEEANRWYDGLAAAARLPLAMDRKRACSGLESEINSRESALRKPAQWVIAAVSPRKRNEMLSTAMLAAMAPTTRAMLEAHDRAQAVLELTQFAAALAAYRAEHDEYPDRLNQLVPIILPQLPVDLFHDKPFVYQRDADGYLLYTCGPNGIDDGGSGQISNKLAGRPIDSLPRDQQEAAQQKIPGSADDISIRVPTPAFKLPTPNAPTENGP